MEDNTIENTYQDVKFNLDDIVKEIETISNQKAIKDSIFNTTYLIGNVTEDNLIDIGFKYFGESNTNGYKTDIYKMGNIEAIFVEQILHVYEIK